MKLTIRIFCLLFFIATLAEAATQRKIPSYEKYIKTYSALAIEQQKKYKIPASITLAQGLLESGAGQSDLARRSNNHFGIKCHSDWRGGRVYHDDDLRGECFRKYKRVEDSYEDHSKFLKRSRYDRLFQLKITDYKGWARGLQKCGYATDRAYANKLIKVIEDYELYRYDTGKVHKLTRQEKKKLKYPTVKYTIYRTYGLLYVYAKENDSFDQIAQNLDFPVKDLKSSTKYRKTSRCKKAISSILKRRRRKPISLITTMLYKSENPCTASHRNTEYRSRACIR